MTFWQFHQFIIEERPLSFVFQESSIKFPVETGGILAGYLDQGVIRITHVTGPGPNAVHTRGSFLRDGEYCQMELDKFFEQTNGKVDYLGEWHSHPFEMGPSRRDKDSLREIALDSKYAIAEPLMGLCIKQTRGWRFECYSVSQYTYSRATRLQSPI